MKLFVTGVAGRLGRAIAREAQAQGILIAGVDQTPWPADVEMPGCVSFHQGTLGDDGLIDRLLPGCTGIINTGGLHGANLGQAGMDAFIDANVTAVAKLLARAREHGAKCAALSSTMEILIGRTGVNGPEILDESSALRCDSFYSASKHLMEVLAGHVAREGGLSVSSLRYMAFGYGAENAGGLRLLSKLLHSRDAARAAIRAAQTPGLAGEVFNIGPGTPLLEEDLPMAVSDPVALLEKRFPGSGVILGQLNMKVTTKDFFPCTRVDKARRLLGWEPTWTFGAWLATQGWKGADALDGVSQGPRA